MSMRTVKAVDEAPDREPWGTRKGVSRRRSRECKPHEMRVQLPCGAPYHPEHRYANSSGTPDVAAWCRFHLLHDLIDADVEHRHHAEALDRRS